MIKISQAIVVEGKYDKITLSQVVDAPIFQTDGFAIMHDKQLLALLRRVAEKRGLIVFTDSDGAGFVIRNKLKSCIPAEHLLNAYIPDIYGKERRKSAPGKEGKLGVEGMTPQVILDCLLRAGATVEGENLMRREPEITKQDMMELGLSGAKNSTEKRKKLMNILDLPEHMSSNAFLQAVNMLCTREEFIKLTENL